MSDIYKIAVRLSMESNAPAVLAVLSRQLLGVHADVRKLEGSLLSLDRVKLAVFGGITAGGAFLTGLKKITDQASALNHELATVGTMSRNALTSVGLQADALNTARATAAAVHGTSIAGNTKLFGETYSMFGREGAQKVNGPLAMFGQVLGGIMGDYAAADEKLYAMLRAAELSGKLVDEQTRKVDPDKMLGFLSMSAKVAAATHGRVGPDALFALAQQGGPALATMSDDGLTSMAMAAQGMGGFRAGTALSSLFAQAQGGKMTVGVAEEMKKLGLVKGFSSDHGHAKFTSDQLDTSFSRAMLADPLKAAEILTKQMSANGINGLEDQTKELFKVLGRQTTQRLLSDFIRNMPQMLAERGRIEGAEGVKGQYDKRNADDYETNLHNVEEAWRNFTSELGLPLTYKAIGILQEMTKDIDSFTSTVQKMDPNTIVNVAKGVGILGASLIGAGGVALLAALGPAGWIVAGVGALCATVTAFDPTIFTKLDSAIDAFFGTIKKWLGQLGTNLSPKDNKGFGQDGEMFPQNQSYTGSGVFGGNLIKAALTDGGGSGRVVAGSITGGISNSNIVILGGGGAGGGLGGFGGGFGGSGGLGGGGWGRGSNALLAGFSSRAGISLESVRQYIRAQAGAIGIDPGIAERVARSEGLNRLLGLGGDHGTSDGPFQLHVGGGIGDLYQRTTGHSIHDMRYWQDQVRFALAYARKHGWGSWYGARNSGIANWQGIGVAPVPTARNTAPVHVHTHVLLDGKVVAKNVTKHQVAAMRHAGSLGGNFDDHGMRAAAGQSMFGA